MNELSYLIIEAGINDAYYNTASLVNLYPREPKFVGLDVRELERQFGKLIDEGVLVALPGPAKNYELSTKGRTAFNEEKQRRLDKKELEELQKSVSESVLETNHSVVATNESVKQTNASIQKLNDFSVRNFKVQNRIARAAVLVSAVALIIAIGSLWQNTSSKIDPELLKQLQEVNKHLERQNKILDSVLKIQHSGQPLRK